MAAAERDASEDSRAGWAEMKEETGSAGEREGKSERKEEFEVRAVSRHSESKRCRDVQARLPLGVNRSVGTSLLKSI